MPPGSICEHFCAGKFVTSLQLDPPTPDGLANFKKRALKLPGLGVDLVDINSSKKEPSADSLVAGNYLSNCGLKVIPHIAVRDNGLRRLRNEIFASYELFGLRDVLIIKGDPYESSVEQCAVGSVEVIRYLDLDLRRSKICPYLRLAAAFNQNADDFKSELVKFRLKEAFGADFFMSQPVFDIEQFEMLEKVYHLGSDKPLLVGVFPLPYFGVAQVIDEGGVPGVFLPQGFLKEISTLAENPERLREWAVEETAKLIRYIKDSQSVAGVYVVAPRRMPNVAVEVIQMVNSV